MIAALSLWTPLAQPQIAQRWFSLPNMFWFLPVPLLVAAAGFDLIRRGAPAAGPFLLSLGLVFLGYSGLGISIWPAIIPPDVSIWTAAAPPQSLGFALVGALAIIPVILMYTAGPITCSAARCARARGITDAISIRQGRRHDAPPAQPAAVAGADLPAASPRWAWRPGPCAWRCARSACPIDPIPLLAGRPRGTAMKRYEKLTEEITGSILSGLLQAGDRLPSVRQTSASRGVSPSTVFKAYYLLEARGLIRARDRSGYYVLRAPQATLPELEAVSSAAAVRHPVDVSDKVLQVLNATLRRDMLPFGSAFPNPSLLPYGRLAKFMASTVQKLDPWGSIDDLSPGDAALRRAIALRYRRRPDGAGGRHHHHQRRAGRAQPVSERGNAAGRRGDRGIADLLRGAAIAGTQPAARHRGGHPSARGHRPDALAQAIVRHKPRACWLMTTFQNPLGSLMPDAKKEALVKLLTPRRGADRGRRLRRALFRRQAPAPGQGLRPRGDRDALFLVLEDAGAGLPGRLGRRRPHTRRIMRNKLTTSRPPPRPPGRHRRLPEKGGFDRHLRQFRQQLALQQGEMLQAVARHFPKGTRATRPQGGYFIWVELPERIDTLQLHRAALGHGISIAPGPLFSATGGFGNFLRLNYGHPWNGGLEQGMATLGKLMGG